MIHRICRALKNAGIPYAIVGGYAVALHGAIRGTVDVDFVIQWTSDNLQKTEAALHQLGLVSRLPLNAAAIFEELLPQRKEMDSGTRRALAPPGCCYRSIECFAFLRSGKGRQVPCRDLTNGGRNFVPPECELQLANSSLDPPLPRDPKVPRTFSSSSTEGRDCAELPVQNKEEFVQNKNLIAWNFYNPSNPSEQIDLIITYDLPLNAIQTIQTRLGEISVLSKSHLIEMKKRSGRPQDLEDIQALESL